MLTILRYLLTFSLVVILSGSSATFVALGLSSSLTEQNEKIESETFVDEAIPHSRFKKQLCRQFNPFVGAAPVKQPIAVRFIGTSPTPHEAFLFLKYRKLII